jgi:hypothetical protein
MQITTALKIPIWWLTFWSGEGGEGQRLSTTFYGAKYTHLEAKI